MVSKKEAIMLNKILSIVLAPYFFVVSFWRSFLISSRYNFVAGYQLGERRSLTGKEFTNADIRNLAARLMQEDQILQEHRQRYGKE